ncbi:uncharacterized protein LOC124180771 [Neodiprion fabricii]|uniref:uncharacterized protein LOC124180771 n=1 Tax=Neodiprion fabricii TaxID=2872261 RepID=UPI001ED91D7E|nr:uncharacterized protein LOC124180771 [Neodiprion fabricii]
MLKNWENSSDIEHRSLQAFEGIRGWNDVRVLGPKLNRDSVSILLAVGMQSSNRKNQSLAPIFLKKEGRMRRVEIHNSLKLSGANNDDDAIRNGDNDNGATVRVENYVADKKLCVTTAMTMIIFARGIRENGAKKCAAEILCAIPDRMRSRMRSLDENSRSAGRTARQGTLGYMTLTRQYNRRRTELMYGTFGLRR